MNAGTAFVIGSWSVAVAFMAAAWWLVFRRNSPVIVIDPYWLGNEDRWADLRNILIEERSARAHSTETP